MAYFRKVPKIQEMLDRFSSKEDWLILVNADPDAMASAMALKRIMSRRVCEADIARINEITRPDNLAMVQSTHLHMSKFDPAMLSRYDRFAIVDSQPHHSPLFQNVAFSIIIDHHPLPETPAAAPYTDIRPDYGATSTLLTEYLYNLDIRPGKLLATALQYGIKSDTMNFTRKLCDADLRAFQFLARFSDQSMLSRISRSEFHRRWLPFFGMACDNLHAAGTGQFVFIGKVENPDILVVIADFLTRVYEFRWVAVSGVYGGTVVVIYRGDGSRDIGRLASAQFSDIGSAGGHKALARAEFPASAAGEGDLELFIFKRVLSSPRKKAAREATGEHGEGDGTPPAATGPKPS
ncbi:DHH family protein [uncultured delta proteobacterium]|uniref:DHH family protein n=1 Tax=uncultured delta proteobacterium TaxID=34034 RepID=A0A212KCQ0_9DELT|nr:DHH family protein [uncultured delta proteobacterium]